MIASASVRDESLSCPSCQQPIHPEDWFCPYCGHQLRSEADIASSLAELDVDDAKSPDDDPTQLDVDTTREVTETTAWQGQSSSGDALIVGDLEDEASDLLEVDTFAGAVRNHTGRTETYLMYAKTVTRALSPETILIRTNASSQGMLTPYEQFVLQQLDGQKSIRNLRQDGLLAPDEMYVTLLTLLDRGLVAAIGRAPSSAELLPVPPLPESHDLTESAPASLSPEPSPVSIEEPPSPGKPLLELEPSQDDSTASKAPPPMLDPQLLTELSQTPPPVKTPRPRLPSRPPGAPPRPAPSSDGITFSPEKHAKAEQLYDAALRDRDAGNLVSARMNLKLAIAFAPHREAYQTLFNQLAHLCDDQPAKAVPRDETARGLYFEAEQAEMRGETDLAIQYLGQAIDASREPMILNRLGVILAARKRRFETAAKYLEAAVQLAPENPVYAHNLSKVLDRLVSPPDRANEKPAPKEGFWRRLVKRGR